MPKKLDDPSALSMKEELELCETRNQPTSAAITIKEELLRSSFDIIKQELLRSSFDIIKEDALRTWEADKKEYQARFKERIRGIAPWFDFDNKGYSYARLCATLSKHYPGEPVNSWMKIPVDELMGYIDAASETQKPVTVKDDSKHPTEQQIRDLYNDMKERFIVMKKGRDRRYKDKAINNGHGFDDIGFNRTVDSWVAYEKKTIDKIVWYSLNPSDVKKLRSFFPAKRLKN